MASSELITLENMEDILPILFCTVIIFGAIRHLIKGKYCLYIESPSGKIYKFPMWEALRIVRKQGWELAEVEPIKPKLSRWQHLKLAIIGNKE